MEKFKELLVESEVILKSGSKEQIQKLYDKLQKAWEQKKFGGQGWHSRTKNYKTFDLVADKDWYEENKKTM